MVTGASQVKPPSKDRLARTALPTTLKSMASPAMIQELVLGSVADGGSAVRFHGPGGFEYCVGVGRLPVVQVPPVSGEVGPPVLSEPPSGNRPPPWKVPTMVLPYEYVSGSSSA